jgi:hypothetical protein
MKFLKQHAMICLLVLFTAGMVLAADPTGKWSWTYKAGKKDAPKEVTATADLKLADGKLTGTVTPPGKKSTPVEIKDGKVDGDKVSFKTVTEQNGKEITTEYSGKQEGDAINGKISISNGGKARELDWKATRSK